MPKLAAKFVMYLKDNNNFTHGDSLALCILVCLAFTRWNKALLEENPSKYTNSSQFLQSDFEVYKVTATRGHQKKGDVIK